MSDGLAPFLQDLGDTRKPGEIRMTKSRGLERLFIPEVVDQTYSPDMPCRSHPSCLVSMVTIDQILFRNGSTLVDGVVEQCRRYQGYLINDAQDVSALSMQLSPMP